MADDQERLDRTVFLRRIPKRVVARGEKTGTKDVIDWVKSLLSSLDDPIEDIFFLHSRCTAQVQLRLKSDAELLVRQGRYEWSSTSRKMVDIGCARNVIIREPQMERSDGYIREEVRRSLNQVIRDALTELGRYNHKRKKEEEAEYKRYMKRLKTSDDDDRD